MRNQAFNEPIIENTVPLFKNHTLRILQGMLSYSPAELSEILGINSQLAVKNALFYKRFLDEERLEWPAILAFQGAVYKQLYSNDLLDESLIDFLSDHLFIADPFYGLLRASDTIRQHRMEGNIVLETLDGESVFNSWRPILTDFLIKEVQKDGGVLINLASKEMQSLFDWKKVCQAVKVITPTFKVLKNGKYRQIVMYTKMARGNMLAQIAKCKFTDDSIFESIKSLQCNGFEYVDSRKTSCGLELLYIKK
jgi:cytoplasmic iron level regulating protein YaaA (DUF328/UPF0246 family)